MTLTEAVEKKSILICCGSGGVGKTTVAAAIALEAARLGKKALVLTIDPAKRLATALGLEQLSDEPKEVRIPEACGEGRLFAMMLDTKRTFDRLIERYTTSEEARRSILENRLYQHMSSMIAGSQEYMAMERLYEIHRTGRFDLIVLDTPPTRHALDFLEAPKKMINLTSNSILKWFLVPGLFASRIGLGALQKGADKILSVFDRLAGFSFLHELSEMISLIGGLLGGFRERAESVYELLRKNFVGFLLITAPSSVAIQDSLYFFRKIDEAGLPFLGFLINRVLPSLPALKERPTLTGFSEPLREKIVQGLERHRQLALRDARAIQLLKKMGGKEVLCRTIPLFGTDRHDLEGLAELNRSLFNPTDSW